MAGKQHVFAQPSLCFDLGRFHLSRVAGGRRVRPQHRLARVRPFAIALGRTGNSRPAVVPFAMVCHAFTSSQVASGTKPAPRMHVS
jgi:hypothetical protein